MVSLARTHARHRIGRRGAPLRVRAVIALACGLTALGAAAWPSLPGAAPAAGLATGNVAGPATAAQARAIPRRPNVVVVMADDMRHDDLRFAPNVRRLFRAGGVEFRNSFANYPLCCPARASFLTGQLARNHGVLSHLKPYGFGSFDDSRTLATTLRRAGYRTGFVGKYLNGYGAQRSRVTGGPSYRYVPRGWTRWLGAVQRPAGRPSLARGGTYDYRRTVYNIDGRPSGRRFHGEYQTNTLGRFSRQLVDRFSPGTRPFFLYLSFVAPHHGGPREADDPRPHRIGGRTFTYKTPAVPRGVRGRFDRVVRRAPGVPANGSDPDPRVGDLPLFLRRKPLDGYDRRALREMTRQRAESIFVLDREVGRLAARLRKRGELRRTVLMFTSDNGFFLGEHRMRGGKILAHEPSLRVPFLIRGPGIPAGQRRYAPVSTVDQAATVLSLAGVARRHPLALDGRSILPDLSRDRGWTRVLPDEAWLASLARRDPAFPDARGAIGIRTARWSYIRYRSGAAELYDLKRDPNQLVNRIKAPGLADVRAALHEVWLRSRSCRGGACQIDLPPALARDRASTKRLTERWHASVRR